MDIWAVWLALVLGTFFALEVPAIANTVEGDTLSERLRAWLGIRPRRWWRVIGAWLFLGFLGWFAVHILTGIV